jgi:hypothetical protein
VRRQPHFLVVGATVLRSSTCPDRHQGYLTIAEPIDESEQTHGVVEVSVADHDRLGRLQRVEVRKPRASTE